MTTIKRNWSEQETEILTANYGKVPLSQLSKMLERPRRIVIDKAAKLRRKGLLKGRYVLKHIDDPLEIERMLKDWWTPRVMKVRVGKRKLEYIILCKRNKNGLLIIILEGLHIGITLR